MSFLAAALYNMIMVGLSQVEENMEIKFKKKSRLYLKSFAKLQAIHLDI